MPVHLAPLKRPFPKWYDVNAHCDHHVEIMSHSMEDCTSVKYKVQRLIKVGVLKFENLDRPNKVKNTSPNSSDAKVEVIRQEKEALRKTDIEKMVMPTKKAFATMDNEVKEREARFALTIERSEERVCGVAGLKVKPKDEEKKAL